MAETLYEMMVKLGLDHTTLMLGLNQIGARLVNLSTQAKSTQIALQGLGAIALGSMTLMGLEKIMDKVQGISDELVKLKNLGGEMGRAASSGELYRRAFEISRTVPLKVEDLLKIPGQTYSLVDKPGSIEESMKLWEPLAKYIFGQQSNAHFHGDPTKNIRDIIKAGDIMGRITDPSGAIDPEKVQRWLDLVAKTKAASHGTVNEQTFLGLAKQGGGISLKSLSDEGMLTEAIMAQNLGGPRAGTALISMWQQLVAGRMTAKSAEGLQGLGLLRADEYDVGKQGSVTVSAEGKKRLAGLINKDPLILAENIRKYYESHGITDPAEQMAKVAEAMGRQTTQRATAEMVLNWKQMIKERELMGMGAGSEATYENRLAGSISANKEALGNAWDNFWAALGGPNSENYIKILQALTAFLNNMQEAVSKIDPDTIKNIGIGLTALGVAMIGAGMGAVILAIGPTGWLIAAFTALAAINWDKMKAFWGWVEVGANILRNIDKMSEGGPDRPDVWLSDKIRKMFGGSQPPPPATTDQPRPQNQSFQGQLNDPSSALRRINFSFDNSKQVLQPVQVKLDLDGRTLAQAVMDILQDLSVHPTQAPTPNGQLAFRAVDGGYSST